MAVPTVIACDGSRTTPAMAAALAAIAALPPRPTAAEACARLQARWEAGERPTHDAWGNRIIADPDRERRIIEQRLTAARWETQAGEVEAARARMRGA